MKDKLTLQPASSFPPIVGHEPRILILGSMPGIESLKQQRYYAHPRNAFWPIITSFFGQSVKLDYPQRCDLLIQKRIAVWDVLKSCRRPGSLDQHIETESMVANDFVELLQRHPSIRQIFFNGGKAEQVFKRYVIKQLEAADILLNYQRLPSTSPAHAAMKFETKQQLWHQALSAPPIG
ncbi:MULTISPECIES: DNA-deoxyinosine glycosylase [unclassified Methylophaga]|jgi:hypoxanthine-DNA glycosylase|uniref:DNA-deoxyinosine glycosylase n=2 Tax=Methylophaga TaxID=40222 RepID=UPI000C945672|nr:MULTISPECIES: DNA-deoxyinosine glycosylase [unclassified Methylophaga]MAK66907.1 DNA-deoxyinosine glycosylase [Methylophaga sp.]MAY17943.1 DNA-deoxyinosine glycosylase [Methylophaga sp.]MBN47153.1 DNA-deoxyinosine glycosylase [Methylophaga sp.]HAO25160.1 DNA-deoxyinosine glycosylase [Methylophaga sp.]HCD04595.1 DNA-deoxyinosine glycosylase [Methylophaga sp.]|tara:strand:+ start:7491 stop:8027 length:537 start_codon:yes stop_codon:yes gene_type:complete